MESLANIHSYMEYQALESGAFGGHLFAQSPSQSANLSRHAYFVDEELQRTPDIVEPVRLLLELGLDLGRILNLRQSKYRNALDILAGGDEDQIRSAYGLLGFGQSRPLSQQTRAGLAQQSYMHPPSRVPSLISDRSSVRGSANLSVPIYDKVASGSGYTSDISSMSSQWCLTDDMIHAPTGYIQHTPMDYCTSGEEDRQSYELGPPFAERVGFYMQQQQDKHALPPTIPAAVEVLFPPGRGERKLSCKDTVNRPPFIAEQEPTRNRNQIQKPRCPCPEDGCTKDYWSPKELAKHLIADHDKDSTFSCKHFDCLLQTHRLTTWKRHHTTHHGECEANEECLGESRTRERKHWACGFCVNLEKDVSGFAMHYKNHFEHGNVQKSDICVSTIIQSLLTQDATRDKWNELSVDYRYPDGRLRLSWDVQKVAEIREALEYETFRDFIFGDAKVVDQLLQEVVTCATYHP